MNLVSLMTSAALVATLVNGNQIRTPSILTALQSNAAITCLANIKRENEKYKYTICSANDELRMMEDYARHEETITFLRSMEGDAVNGNLTLPTDRVYFFIEKIPLDYTVDMREADSSFQKKEQKNRCQQQEIFRFMKVKTEDRNVKNVLLGTGIYGTVWKRNAGVL